MGFTKLDSGIVDSSIWDEHSNVLKVFVAFWTKCNAKGIVNATYNSMFRSANLCDENKNPLSIEYFEKALDILLSPDPTSKSIEYEGRRIIRIEESKWLVVTYAKRREYTYSDNPEAVRKREFRKKEIGTLRDMSQSVPGHSASVSDSASDSGKEEGMQGGKENNLEKRTERFKSEIFNFSDKYQEPMLKDFFEYWSELNRSRTRMRFEFETTWDLKKRLERWERNNYGFSNHGKARLQGNSRKNKIGKPGYDAAGNAIGAQAGPGEFPEPEGFLTLDGIPDNRTP